MASLAYPWLVTSLDSFFFFFSTRGGNMYMVSRGQGCRPPGEVKAWREEYVQQKGMYLHPIDSSLAKVPRQ